MYGSQYRDQLSEVIRRAAEFCDCLQCFFVLHSMGGGKFVVVNCAMMFLRKQGAGVF